MDPVSVAALVGGLVGSALRALGAPEQGTFSRKSIVDVAVGGLVGVMIPATIGLPAEWSLLVKGAAVAFVSYTSANLLQDVAGQMSKLKKPA